MRTVPVVVIPLVVLLCCGLIWAESEIFSLDATLWKPVPEALSNTALTSSVSVEGTALCFTVNSRNRGMKWQCETPTVIDTEAYFLIRYKAENLNRNLDEFIVSVNQGAKDEEHLVMTKDIIDDGDWHLLAVDLLGLPARIIDSLWVQVQATRLGDARLYIDYLGFSNQLPAEAEVIKAGGTKETVQVDGEGGDAQSMVKTQELFPGEKFVWVARPSWLGNPTSNPGCREVSVPAPYSTTGTGWRFEVPEQGRGMKWTCTLDEDSVIDTTDTPYLVVRYRAQNITNDSGKAFDDYFIWIYDIYDGEHIPLNLPEIQDDGRWNMAVVPMPPIQVKTIIVQVQAGRPDAFVEIGTLGFYGGGAKLEPGPDSPPVTVASLMEGTRRLQDYLDYSYGWDDADLDCFVPLPLSQAQVDVGVAYQRDEFDGRWFTQPKVAVRGPAGSVPFMVNVEGCQLVGTSIAGVEAVEVEVGTAGKSLYLLMGARFLGDEDPSLGGGALTAINQVERFLVEIQYEDGSKEQIFPQLLDSGKHQIRHGFGVYVLNPAKPDVVISRLRLIDEMRNGAFYLGGITAGKKVWDEAIQLPKVLPPAETPEPPQDAGAGRIYVDDDRVVFENDAMELVIGLGDLPRILSLKNRYSNTQMVQGPSPIFEFQGMQARDFSLLDTMVDDQGMKLRITASDMELEFTARFDANGEVVFGLQVINQGDKAIAPPLRFPVVRNVGFIADQETELARLWYVYPRRGVYITDRVFNAGVLYSGYFPMQFLSFFNPDRGGFYIITRDLELTHKIFELRKNEDQTGSLSVYYDNEATNTIEPQDAWTLPEVALGVYEGSWHGSFFAYKNWVDSWYQPLAPRKDWFLEVFNFRQQFLHFAFPRKTGMFDEKQKVFDFQPTIDADTAAFGSVDYLHIFDWGWTPTYGRVGDYQPWEYLGSAGAFAEAIAQVHAQGIPVGLYLEGYLASPESIVGRTYGTQWQLLNRDLRPYPQWSPDYDMCPHCEPWQDYLSGVYRNVWELTGAKGFYLDQFGFAGYEKFCYSSEHGHLPGIPPVRGEATILKKVRAQLPDDVVLYTEEAPVDVVTQFQDGAFSYAIGFNQPEWSPHGLNLYRFVFPDFKLIEIIAVDKPLGSNYQSLKQVFFNGEAVWLMGLPEYWYTPETLTFIKKMNQVLKDYADAFTSPNPFPLYPTLLEGVYANMFPASDKIVWTLYNSHYRSVNTEILRVPHRSNADYLDIWNEQGLDVRVEGEYAYLTVEIPPKGVVAVMQRWE